VARFERVLRERLAEPTLHVVVRRTVPTDIAAKGRILLGEAHFGPAAGKEEPRAAGERAVRANLGALPNTFALAVDAVRDDGGWRVRGEVVGPRVLAPADVRQVEERSAQAVGAPVTLSVWARAEIRGTAERYAPVAE
jgi:hypothetical protein